MEDLFHTGKIQTLKGSIVLQSIPQSVHALTANLAAFPKKISGKRNLSAMKKNCKMKTLLDKSSDRRVAFVFSTSKMATAPSAEIWFTFKQSEREKRRKVYWRDSTAGFWDWHARGKHTLWRLRVQFHSLLFGTTCQARKQKERKGVTGEINSLKGWMNCQCFCNGLQSRFANPVVCWRWEREGKKWGFFQSMVYFSNSRSSMTCWLWARLQSTCHPLVGFRWLNRNKTILQQKKKLKKRRKNSTCKMQMLKSSGWLDSFHQVFQSFNAKLIALKTPSWVKKKWTKEIYCSNSSEKVCCSSSVRQRWSSLPRRQFHLLFSNHSSELHDWKDDIPASSSCKREEFTFKASAIALIPSIPNRLSCGKRRVNNRKREWAVRKTRNTLLRFSTRRDLWAFSDSAMIAASERPSRLPKRFTAWKDEWGSISVFNSLKANFPVERGESGITKKGERRTPFRFKDTLRGGEWQEKGNGLFDRPFQSTQPFTKLNWLNPGLVFPVDHLSIRCPVARQKETQNKHGEWKALWVVEMRTRKDKPLEFVNDVLQNLLVGFVSIVRLKKFEHGTQLCSNRGWQAILWGKAEGETNGIINFIQRCRVEDFPRQLDELVDNFEVFKQWCFFIQVLHFPRFGKLAENFHFLDDCWGEKWEIKPGVLLHKKGLVGCYLFLTLVGDLLHLILEVELWEEIHFLCGWFFFNVGEEQLLDWHVLGEVSFYRFIQNHFFDLRNSLQEKNKQMSIQFLSLVCCLPLQSIQQNIPSIHCLQFWCCTFLASSLWWLAATPCPCQAIGWRFRQWSFGRVLAMVFLSGVSFPVVLVHQFRLSELWPPFLAALFPSIQHLWPQSRWFRGIADWFLWWNFSWCEVLLRCWLWRWKQGKMQQTFGMQESNESWRFHDFKVLGQLFGMRVELSRGFFHFLVVDFSVQSSKGTECIGAQWDVIISDVFRTQQVVKYTEGDQRKQRTHVSWWRRTKRERVCSFERCGGALSPLRRIGCGRRHQASKVQCVVFFSSGVDLNVSTSEDFFSFSCFVLNSMFLQVDFLCKQWKEVSWELNGSSAEWVLDWLAKFSMTLRILGSLSPSSIVRPPSLLFQHHSPSNQQRQRRRDTFHRWVCLLEWEEEKQTPIENLDSSQVPSVAPSTRLQFLSELFPVLSAEDNDLNECTNWSRRGSKQEKDWIEEWKLDQFVTSSFSRLRIRLFHSSVQPSAIVELCVFRKLFMHIIVSNEEERGEMETLKRMPLTMYFSPPAMPPIETGCRQQRR